MRGGKRKGSGRKERPKRVVIGFKVLKEHKEALKLRIAEYIREFESKV